MRARLYGRAADGPVPNSGGVKRHGLLALGGVSLGIGVMLAVVVAAAATALAVASSKGAASTAGVPASAQTPESAPASVKPSVRTRIVTLPKGTVGNATERLTVTLSGTPAPGSPHPTLSPSGYGSWKVSGDSWVFKSSTSLLPCSSYQLTVSAGTTATGDSSLGASRSIALDVACPSTRGLQQALARLAYLPDSLHAALHAHVLHGAIGRRNAAHLLYEPVAGALQPDLALAPPLSYGRLDNTTKGALMVFQEDHKLQPDGTPGPLTWQKLLTAVAGNYRNPKPYTFVTVTESLPETLEVHRGNRVVLSTPANTGVAGAETQQGSFPIYERFTSTTMTGTNPDGSKYSDPGVPWVNYFNGGDAVHGFPRPGYGYPQSNGCVELPIETAHTVFYMLRLGDMVVVS
jgi:peptidoglycan hydrolase-like protein with peptidoglycan-binding domain